MKIKLVCSRDQKLLYELLKAKGLEITETAGITFVEKGCSLPENGIAVIFNPGNISELVDFIDHCNISMSKSDSILVGKRDGAFKPLALREISYFMGYGNYVFCFINDKKYEINKKLYELENNLANKGFVRINKSHIINIIHIKEIIPWFSGRLLLKLKNIKKELEVSRNYAKQFKRYLDM